jgi:hypothetical protein
MEAPCQRECFPHSASDWDRIQRFLESRYSTFTTSVAITEEIYQQRCRGYLESILGIDQQEEDRAEAQLVLSNAMDLTTAAQILLNETPPSETSRSSSSTASITTFGTFMSASTFLLKRFSESVYAGATVRRSYLRCGLGRIAVDVGELGGGDMLVFLR